MRAWFLLLLWPFFNRKHIICLGYFITQWTLLIPSSISFRHAAHSKKRDIAFNPAVPLKLQNLDKWTCPWASSKRHIITTWTNMISSYLRGTCPKPSGKCDYTSLQENRECKVVVKTASWTKAMSYIRPCTEFLPWEVNFAVWFQSVKKKNIWSISEGYDQC